MGAPVPTEAQLAAAHETLRNTPGLQLEFAQVPPPPPPPPWLEPLLKAIVASFPVLKIVFWIGVAAAAAMVLWLIVRDLPPAQLFRRKRAQQGPVDWRPEAEAARALLQDVDRLAAEGRFAEAVHLLLFRSIADIAAKRPRAVRPALTSRELVETAPLSESGRSAFRLIADAVERSFFGGRDADAETFARCRREYEAFALAEAGA